MSKPTKVKEGIAGVMGAGEGGRIQVLAQCHDHTLTLVGMPAKVFYSDPKKKHGSWIIGIGLLWF